MIDLCCVVMFHGDGYDVVLAVLFLDLFGKLLVVWLCVTGLLWFGFGCGVLRRLLFRLVPLSV